MNCIYRHINTCRVCNFKSKDDYCRLHQNNRNYIYEIINKAIGTRPIRNSNDIFEIFVYIYENPILTKELIFKKLLLGIINKRNNYFQLFPYINVYKNNIKTIIDYIYKLNYNSYVLIKNHNEILKKVKNRCQRFLVSKHMFRDGLVIMNNTDPFTFDNLDEINKREIFIYNDGITNYFFKAIEFKYFVETNGSWNPYTKKEIDKRVIVKLDLFIKINNLVHKNRNDRFNWLSVDQAFLDVSQTIEKMGFYNNSEWFLKLTIKQIKSIIRLFRVMSSGNEEYFNNIDENNIFFDFAKDIIRLFEEGNSNFLACCMFMKSIAVYSNDFYNSLPEWIADIETPLIVIDNSNLFYLINMVDSS